jgi:hypothetical protein
MKTMMRRLRRIEARLAPKPDFASERLAELIRERRRRRLEAAGQPYEELPWHPVELPPGRRLSIAETVRIGRKLAQHRNPATAAAEK